MKKIINDIKASKAFLKNCKKEIILIIILSIFVTLISIINPSICGMIVNNILASNFKKSFILAIAISVFQFALVSCNLLISKNYLKAQQKMILNIRKSACRLLLNLKLGVITKKGQGKFLSRIKGDSTKIASYFSNMKDSIVLALSNIGVLFIIFKLNYIIGIYYLICTIILLTIRYYGVKKSLYYRKLNLELSDNNSMLLGQVIKGARDIKVLKLKSIFNEQADRSFEQISNLEYKSNIYFEYTNKICNFIETVSTGCLIFLSIFLIKINALTTDSFVIIFMYRTSIFTFSNKIGQLLNQFGQFQLSLDRILAIFEYSVESYGNVEMKDYLGSIKFDHVSYEYEEGFSLKDISFNVDNGAFISFVGKSGSGKSTIFSLLTKIIEPDKGSIYFDSYNLSDVTEDSIRENISLVTQQPFLFNMTIRENLSIIDDNVDHINKVCHDVGLDRLISNLENGYDTVIDEDGGNLSGGEKQKLALARVLLSNTKVILLDEVTNNLDNTARNDIKEIINSLKGKYTIIMITHDMDMIDTSDNIIVLNNGEIVGMGTHNELLKTNSYYEKLYYGDKDEA